jgi:hypothetical protein
MRNGPENWIQPTHPEIQCKSLGMKIEVFDPDGKNIEHTGIAGEMVRAFCLEHFFHVDPLLGLHTTPPLASREVLGRRLGSQIPRNILQHVSWYSFCISLRLKYALTCKGIWRQGDFIVVNPKTKGIMILGRRCVVCHTQFCYLRMLIAYSGMQRRRAQSVRCALWVRRDIQRP